MSAEKSIKLYSTHPHSCSYFKEREARTLFVDPHMPFNNRLYTELSKRGFRRSGEHIYRPDCGHCQACIASRVPVSLFKPSRSQRRCKNRNKDLTVSVKTAMPDNAYALYESYINVRHKEGDMYPPSREQFEQFLGGKLPSSRYACFYLQKKLVAVAVIDIMHDGLSAIYSFYDSGLDKRSLGVMAILWQIQYCRELQLSYVYLGYWIRNCAKMQYKTDYRPIELYISDHWVQLN